MYECMFVRMCVSMYVCEHACLCVFVRLNVCMYMYICVYTYFSTLGCVHVRDCMSVQTCAGVCCSLHVCVYIPVHVQSSYIIIYVCFCYCTPITLVIASLSLSLSPSLSVSFADLVFQTSVTTSTRHPNQTHHPSSSTSTSATVFSLDHLNEDGTHGQSPIAPSQNHISHVQLRHAQYDMDMIHDTMSQTTRTYFRRPFSTQRETKRRESKGNSKQTQPHATL